MDCAALEDSACRLGRMCCTQLQIRGVRIDWGPDIAGHGWCRHRVVASTQPQLPMAHHTALAATKGRGRRTRVLLRQCIYTIRLHMCARTGLIVARMIKLPARLSSRRSKPIHASFRNGSIPSRLTWTCLQGTDKHTSTLAHVFKVIQIYIMACTCLTQAKVRHRRHGYRGEPCNLNSRTRLFDGVPRRAARAHVIRRFRALVATGRPHAVNTQPRQQTYTTTLTAASKFSYPARKATRCGSSRLPTWISGNNSRQLAPACCGRRIASVLICESMAVDIRVRMRACMSQCPAVPLSCMRIAARLLRIRWHRARFQPSALRTLFMKLCEAHEDRCVPRTIILLTSNCWNQRSKYLFYHKRGRRLL